MLDEVDAHAAGIEEEHAVGIGRAHLRDLGGVIELAEGRVGLADDLARTIDYQAVAGQIQQLAAAKPRCLIETLATETAAFLLANHPLRRVAVTVEKHILPDTDCVAVHVTRSR